MTGLERRILIAARTAMNRPHVDFVCVALEIGMGSVLAEGDVEFWRVNDAYSRLRDWVGRQVHPNATLSAWQIVHGLKRDYEQRKRDRINWISYMLGEL